MASGADENALAHAMFEKHSLAARRHDAQACRLQARFWRALELKTVRACMRAYMRVRVAVGWHAARLNVSFVGLTASTAFTATPGRPPLRPR